MTRTYNQLSLRFTLFPHPLPWLILGDGEEVSVQWCPCSYGDFHTADEADHEFVELGFPSELLRQDLEEYPNDGWVWPRFDRRVLADIIDRHGGIASEVAR